MFYLQDYFNLKNKLFNNKILLFQLNMMRQLYEVNRKYFELFDPLDQLKNEPSQPMAFHLIV